MPLEKVEQILKGWIGQNPEAAQYKCRDLLQKRSHQQKAVLAESQGRP